MRDALLRCKPVSEVCDRFRIQPSQFYQALWTEAICRQTPPALDYARSIVDVFIVHYNKTRLHGSVGYISPHAMPEGQGPAIYADCHRWLAVARHLRQPRLATAITEAVA